ncbi:MAG: GTPase, partial [Frisingicoccus sp.]
LTGAGVLEEDKLFATLDPTTRNLKLDSGQEVLLTDTVGFIRKLPHHLIQAFRSTLEEAKYADIILHVVDASNPQMDVHMHVVYDTLNQLEVGDKPVITLFNKIDCLEDGDGVMKDFRAEKTLKISAKKEIGLEEVKEALEEILRQSKMLIERVFEYSRAGDIAVIRKYGQLLEEEYRADGIFVRAYVPKDVYAQLEF